MKSSEKHDAHEAGGDEARRLEHTTFKLAIESGSLTVVERMAPLFERTAVIDSLRRACVLGNVKVIAALVAWCDKESIGIQLALSASQGNSGAVDVLLSHAGDDYVRKARFMASYCGHPSLVNLIDQHIAEKQAVAIGAGVDESSTNHVQRKAKRM